MNEYLNGLVCRKKVYDAAGSESYQFSADTLIANGICFTLGFVTFYFASPHIPGLKDKL